MSQAAEPRVPVRAKPDPRVTWRFFDSDLVDRIQDKEVTRDPVTGWEHGQHRLAAGRFEFLLARKFGFCYGVKLAIWDSLSALDRHGDRRIVALSEMIHNPYVNDELRRRGAVFLHDAGMSFDDILPTDVVIIPAFGTTTFSFEHLMALEAKGCVLVDTTCRSVIDVWDKVREYNELDFTSVIHGKYEHEETIATASVARRYLIVRDVEETRVLCDYLRGKLSDEALQERFARACSPGLLPRRDLDRIGLANQTTMRSGESEEVFRTVKDCALEVWGAAALAAHYRALDTICRATEVRQQAVIELSSKNALDLMLVIGGFNSSNTKNLAKIAATFSTTYHIDGAWSFDGDSIRHLVYGQPELSQTRDWLPWGGRIGITAGASTPDNTVGEVIEKVLALRPQDCSTPA